VAHLLADCQLIDCQLWRSLPFVLQTVPEQHCHEPALLDTSEHQAAKFPSILRVGETKIAA
jgi:hypothetical protein